MRNAWAEWPDRVDRTALGTIRRGADTVRVSVAAPRLRDRSLRLQLDARRRELVDEISRDAAEVALAPEARGEDLTSSQHPADVASDLDQRERLVAQTGTERVRLVAVDDALARLAAGSYGLCVDCGAEIPLERLIALPQAARCIACQQRGERSHGTGHARR